MEQNNEVKIFKNLEEMKNYFNEETKSYKFFENGKLLDIKIRFNLAVNCDIRAGNIDAYNLDVMNISCWDLKAGNIEAMNITCWNLKAGDILARDIDASNIDAYDIKAHDINFYAVCFAHKDIFCKSITGRHEKSKYFSLNGDIFTVEKIKMKIYFEEDVTEEDVAEEVVDAYEESLPLPCGGVFKGDFYAPKKNQVKAANREWRRRKSTGRFHDDGSRWN